MKVNIKGHTLPLHYSLRIFMIYENVEGSSLDSINATSITSTMSLIYATFVSTLKYNKIDDTLSLDEVIEIVDENGGMKFINEFSQWFAENVNNDVSLSAKREVEVDEADKKKSNA